MAKAWKIFPAPPAPWELAEWDESQLSEEDFWLWLSRAHGRAAAERAWDDYWCAETWDDSRWAEPDWRPSRRFLRCFDNLAGATENHMFATGEDDHHALLVQQQELRAQLLEIRWNLFHIVRVLMRCELRGRRVLESGEDCMRVVDVFMHARGWTRRWVDWETVPDEEAQQIAVALITLAWRVIHLSDERVEELRAHG